MQISTNWSVSHLRHWRPPVTSSGHYLNMYTRESWFKSKQSALRSILPNANIHHNEKRPGRGQGLAPSVHFGVCFSTWGQQVKNSPPVGLKGTAHTKRTEKMPHSMKEWTMADCSPSGNKAECLWQIEKNFLVFDSDKQVRLTSQLNLETWWWVETGLGAGELGGRGWGSHHE